MFTISPTIRIKKARDCRTAIAGSTCSRGFTLVEIMITIVIVAVGLGLAQPALQSFIQSGRLSGAVSEMQAALARARLEAITRGTMVTVEPQKDGIWTNGYRIYVNPFNSTSWTTAQAAGALGSGAGASVVAPETIALGAASSTSVLQWPTNACDTPTTTALTYVTFDEGGRPRAATGSASGAPARSGRITACITAGSCSTPNTCKEIAVDTLGRMRVQAN